MARQPGKAAACMLAVRFGVLLKETAVLIGGKASINRVRNRDSVDERATSRFGGDDVSLVEV